MKKSAISILWHDPVWSKVIAAALIVVAGVAWTYFQGFWPRIGAQVGAGVAWALKRTDISNWLLVLLSASGVAVVIVVILLLWSLVSPSERETSWQSYTEDDFFGIRWRWRYGKDGSVLDLYSLCPSCAYQVYATSASYYAVVPRVAYRCESCGRTLAELEGTSGEIENRVIRHVQQKLRTSSWPKAQRA